MFSGEVIFLEKKIIIISTRVSQLRCDVFLTFEVTIHNMLGSFFLLLL